MWRWGSCRQMSGRKMSRSDPIPEQLCHYGATQYPFNCKRVLTSIFIQTLFCFQVINVFESSYSHRLLSHLGHYGHACDSTLTANTRTEEFSKTRPKLRAERLFKQAPLNSETTWPILKIETEFDITEKSVKGKLISLSSESPVTLQSRSKSNIYTSAKQWI